MLLNRNEAISLLNTGSDLSIVKLPGREEMAKKALADYLEDDTIQ